MNDTLSSFYVFFYNCVLARHTHIYTLGWEIQESNLLLPKDGNGTNELNFCCRLICLSTIKNAVYCEVHFVLGKSEYLGNYMNIRRITICKLFFKGYFDMFVYFFISLGVTRNKKRYRSICGKRRPLRTC